MWRLAFKPNKICRLLSRKVQSQSRIFFDSTLVHASTNRNFSDKLDSKVEIIDTSYPENSQPDNKGGASNEFDDNCDELNSNIFSNPKKEPKFSDDFTTPKHKLGIRYLCKNDSNYSKSELQDEKFVVNKLFDEFLVNGLFPGLVCCVFS